MTINIGDFEHYIQYIDWEILEKQILSQAVLAESHSNLSFCLESPAEIQDKLDITDYFLELIQSDEYNSIRLDLAGFQSDFEFRDSLKKLRIEALMPIEQINQFILGFEFAVSYTEHFEKFNQLIDYDAQAARKITQEFRKFVDVGGELHFEKHPQLKGLYFKLKDIEKKIRSSLDHLIKDPEFSENLQIPQHDVVNDYFVLPIKSDHYQSNFGKIIGRSETGKTLFVEPRSISIENSERLSLVLEIENIINRIESDYISKLNDCFTTIKKAVDIVLFVDEFCARANFCFINRYFKPELLSQPGFQVKKAFHPVIPKSVPNDIIINNGESLVISGPNTGGKTATLKLMALYTSLVKRGFFVPAASAKIHPYQKVFYLGNDLQNIEEGLSSFASEIKSYQDLVKNLGKSNLILIDEIFNSTASEEASSLAYSLLSTLNQNPDNTIVVSTHHQTLKQYLHTDSNFISAHVGFSEADNKPTYKLIYGAPGSSFALEIFSEMAKDSPLFTSILKRARSYIDSNVIHYEKMLSDLSRKQEKLDRKIRENEQINKELKNQKSANEALLKIKMNKRLEEVEREIERLQSEAELILKQVSSGELKNKNKIANKFATVKSDLRPNQDLSQDADEQSYKKPKNIEIGKFYYSTQLRQTVKVTEIKKNKVKVSVGKIKAEVKIESLRMSKKQKPNTPKVSISTQPMFEQRKLEYDCRGMRLSEFQVLVDQVLSDLYMQNMPFANIIHGHGDGILKKWLRGHIKRHPDFVIATNETGNDGESRIELG